MNPTARRIAPPAALLTGRSLQCCLWFAVAFVLAGCGRQGGLRVSGTQPGGDAAAGGSAVGGSADAGSPAGGGGSTASPVGGAVAGGGASGANTAVVGGASLGGSAGGGGSSMGGVTARGGVTSRGGSAGAGMSGGSSAISQGGGGAPSGGSSAATTAAVGGSASGGIAGGGSGGAGTARGGATASGGSVRGGSSGVGGVTASGGATSSGGSPGSGGGGAGGGPDGGIVASGYCTGSDAKVTYLGQTVSAPATSYQSGLALDCCMSYGVNLHSRASLGFDFAVEVILYASVSSGDYEVGAVSYQARAPVRTSNESALLANNSRGNVHIDGGPSVDQAWNLGLCLEVVDTSSALLGTRIFVPSVTVDTYQSYKRFQIYLLQDSSIPALKAAALALDSLELAAQPLLDLGRIAYVEQATTRIGLNPGQKFGDSILASLGHPLGLPFVVVADGVRIYLGTFTSMISSISPAGPNIMTDDITSDELVIQPPWTGTDPRNDPRILQVLTETSKLVP